MVIELETLGNHSSNRTVDEIYTADDVAWILANLFLVLTMQSGFGLLECGFVSSKSISNIMFKNSVDVAVGGCAFWMFGYAFSMGEPSNAFCGYGKFFFSPGNYNSMGTEYTNYMIYLSFASIATTVVSGAVAERMRMTAYLLYSFLSILIYAFPASWIWGRRGFLRQWGFFDSAGASAVHTTGGLSALIAAWLLGPRKGRFNAHDGKKIPKMSSPVTALSGMMILWWAWFGFSCVTTMGMNTDRWKLAALIAANTTNASLGGGCMALILSYAFKRRQYDISYLITGILGGLVGITTISSAVYPGESMLIGAVGAAVAIGVGLLVELCQIDDPVNAVGVHAGASAWAILAVGLFGHTIVHNTHKLPYDGLLYSGEYKALGIQICGGLIIATWSILASLCIFYIISHVTVIRLTATEEDIGSDWIEHGVSPLTVTVIEKTTRRLESDCSSPQIPPGTACETPCTQSAQPPEQKMFLPLPSDPLRGKVMELCQKMAFIATQKARAKLLPAASESPIVLTGRTKLESSLDIPLITFEHRISPPKFSTDYSFTSSGDPPLAVSPYCLSAPPDVNIRNQTPPMFLEDLEIPSESAVVSKDQQSAKIVGDSVLEDDEDENYKSKKSCLRMSNTPTTYSRGARKRGSIQGLRALPVIPPVDDGKIFMIPRPKTSGEKLKRISFSLDPPAVLERPLLISAVNNQQQDQLMIARSAYQLGLPTIARRSSSF